MDSHLRISALQLSNACHNPELIDAIIAGRQTPISESDTRGAVSFRIRALARAFVEWAADPEHCHAADQFTSHRSVYAKLQDLGGHKIFLDLFSEGDGLTAESFHAQLQNLAAFFVRLRESRDGSWSNIFPFPQAVIRTTRLFAAQRVEISVTSLIDLLRFARSGGLEIVDLRLAPSSNQSHDRTHLAISRRLLKSALKDDLLAGCMEIVTDPPQTLFFTDQELEETFQATVLPTLASIASRLVNAPYLRPAPAAADIPQPSAPFIPSESARTLVRVGSRPNGGTVLFDPADLAQHMIVVGESGSGKSTAVLNIIEQTIASGIPAILIDRKGEFARYAEPKAFDGPTRPNDPLNTVRHYLRNHLDVHLLTPGYQQGSPLMLGAAPGGLGEIPKTLRADLALLSADAIAPLLSQGRFHTKERVAALAHSIEFLMAEETQPQVTFAKLIQVLRHPPAPLRAVAQKEEHLVRDVLNAIEDFAVRHADLVDPRLSRFDPEACFASAPHPRLTVVTTQFLRGEHFTAAFLAQIFLQLYCLATLRKQPRLRGVLMLDEAHTWLHAEQSQATKAPLERLLRERNPGGIGFVLCSSDPAELDFSPLARVGTWMLGLTKKRRAIEQLSSLFSARAMPEGFLSGLSVGQFVFASNGKAFPIRSHPSIVETRAMELPELEALARLNATQRSSREASMGPVP
ncbi:MAG: DUF87 domain-containing protein [Verrucomicrobiia bacterium]